MNQTTNRRDETRRRIYGRQRGHKLTARQQALIDDLLPQKRAVPGDPRLADPSTLFSRPEAVWLEIGFGAGEHLAWQAAAHRDIGFIGVEPFVNGVAKLLTRIEEDALDNVVICDGDARDLLEALGAATIARIFVLFPDPWPKARHNKRRLMSTETVAQLARVMADGAELRFASDIGDYVDWTLRRLRASPDFEWNAERADDWRQRPADWPPTRYERKALGEGRRGTYLSFERTARASSSAS